MSEAVDTNNAGSGATATPDLPPTASGANTAVKQQTSKMIEDFIMGGGEPDASAAPDANATPEESETNETGTPESQTSKGAPDSQEETQTGEAAGSDQATGDKQPTKGAGDIDSQTPEDVDAAELLWGKEKQEGGEDKGGEADEDKSATLEVTFEDGNTRTYNADDIRALNIGAGNWANVETGWEKNPQEMINALIEHQNKVYGTDFKLETTQQTVLPELPELIKSRIDAGWSAREDELYAEEMKRRTDRNSALDPDDPMLQDRVREVAEQKAAAEKAKFEAEWKELAEQAAKTQVSTSNTDAERRLQEIENRQKQAAQMREAAKEEARQQLIDFTTSKGVPKGEAGDEFRAVLLATSKEIATGSIKDGVQTLEDSECFQKAYDTIMGFINSAVKRYVAKNKNGRPPGIERRGAPIDKASTEKPPEYMIGDPRARKQSKEMVLAALEETDGGATR